MPYYKLLTSSFPSLPSTMNACSPPSARLQGFFRRHLQICPRQYSPTERSSLSEKAVEEDQIFILTAIVKKTCGHSLFHHYSLSTKTRMDDLHGDTLVSYSTVYIYYEEQLWSVNCSIVSVSGNWDTKDEVNIRLPNVYNKHVKRRGFMKTIRKPNIGTGPETCRGEGMYKGIASHSVLFQRNG